MITGTEIDLAIMGGIATDIETETATAIPIITTGDTSQIAIVTGASVIRGMREVIRKRRGARLSVPWASAVQQRAC
jgi:hypothetical protein